MKEKKMFGLLDSHHFVDDDCKSSLSSEMCLCCSFDKDKLDHYCSVLNDASNIHFKLRPVNTIVEEFRVNDLDLV